MTRAQSLATAERESMLCDADALDCYRRAALLATAGHLVAARDLSAIGEEERRKALWWRSRWSELDATRPGERS